MILETERLYLREMTQHDSHSLSCILQDEEVMYAYEHAFSDCEVEDWLANQLHRYAKDGFGLWAVILKEREEMIGQCGLSRQTIADKRVIEVGYLFQKAYWHQGYASEAAIACKEYAFHIMGVKDVYSIIRDTNIASQNVAIKNGMKREGQITKHYYQMVMPHYIYGVHKK